MPSSFTDTFGGSSVSPAQVAYAAYSFGSPGLTLYWPQFAAGQTNVAARFMNLTATAGSLNVSMPDATLSSAGQDVIIFNAGSNTFNVVDFNGGAIATIATGQTYYILQKTNSTQAGTWQTIQFGVGTGSASASALAGAGLIAIAGLLNSNLSTSTVTNSFTVGPAGRAVLYVWGGGVGTITLPTANSVGGGFFFALANNGSGSVTVSASDNIDGALTSVFTQTQSGFIVSTGSTWVTVGKGTQNAFAFTLLNLNVAGAIDVTETSAQAQNVIQQYTGILTGNINVIVPNTVQMYIANNLTSGAFTLTVKTVAGTGISVTQGSTAILYSDGTNIVNAFTASISGTVSITAGSAPSPSLSIQGSLSTGIYSPSANKLAVTADGLEVLEWSSVASAVNTLTMANGATGNPVTIGSKSGTDTNVSIVLAPQNAGTVNIAAAKITGGHIDGTIIGASVTAAITGTTITASSNFVGNLTGNVTGNLIGNASTATALQNARTIGGVSFDGTGNITVATATGGFTVSGGDLSLSTNNITMTGSLGSTGSRLTKGWFTDLQVTNAISGSITGNAATVTTNANLTGDVTSSGNATTIKSSVALSGSPTTTTQSVNDNSTKIATTAYADAAAAAAQNVKTVKIQTFTSGGTYTPSTGMLYCIVEVLGGGGGGGGFGSSSAWGGSGGSGAYSRSAVSAASIGASKTVTVGAGGTGGNAANGGAGGASSLGILVTANGGSGGLGNGSSTGGAGGTAGTGTLALAGSNGGSGGTAIGNSGASSIFGDGGGVGVSSGSAGSTAGGRGAGGGSSLNATGGAGSAGLVLITEFCSQ